MGTRSKQGSRNIGIFNSLTQTAKLQKCFVPDLFRELLTGTAAKAQGLLFSDSS
jgi:hypothetical protein